MMAADVALAMMGAAMPATTWFVKVGGDGCLLGFSEAIVLGARVILV